MNSEEDIFDYMDMIKFCIEFSNNLDKSEVRFVEDLEYQVFNQGEELTQRQVERLVDIHSRLNKKVYGY